MMMTCATEDTEHRYCNLLSSQTHLVPLLYIDLAEVLNPITH